MINEVFFRLETLSLRNMTEHWVAHVAHLFLFSCITFAILLICGGCQPTCENKVFWLFSCTCCFSWAISTCFYGSIGTTLDRSIQWRILTN